MIYVPRVVLASRSHYSASMASPSFPDLVYSHSFPSEATSFGSKDNAFRPLTTARIMNEGLVVADEERVSLVDGQVVHHLSAPLEGDGSDRASPAERTPDAVARPQIAGLHPAATLHEEWMLGGGFDLFAAERQAHDDRVRMRDGRRDELVRGLAGLFVVGEDPISDLQAVDSNLPALGRDSRVPAEAVRNAARGGRASHRRRDLRQHRRHQLAGPKPGQAREAPHGGSLGCPARRDLATRQV